MIRSSTQSICKASLYYDGLAANYVATLIPYKYQYYPKQKNMTLYVFITHVTAELYTHNYAYNCSCTIIVVMYILHAECVCTNATVMSIIII